MWHLQGIKINMEGRLVDGGSQRSGFKSSLGYD